MIFPLHLVLKVLPVGTVCDVCTTMLALLLGSESGSHTPLNEMAVVLVLAQKNKLSPTSGSVTNTVPAGIV